MAQDVERAARVVSVRFSHDEYQALHSLSVIADESVNALVRRAVVDYIRNFVTGPNYDAAVKAAKQRAATAHNVLLEQLDISVETTTDLSEDSSTKNYSELANSLT